MNTLLDYEKSLKIIKNRLKFGSKPGLGRIKAFMENIKNPQNSLNFIHVAGTNGKGSVCTVISAALSAAGYKTGLYISPSVMDFRERIQIDSSLISKEKVCELVSFLENYANREQFKDDNITEFEFTTAMAFKYFYDEKCDFVVLETGLGGALDATNIIENPICSIITSISYDHTAVLGRSLSDIAVEKSGIIKKFSPVVIGPEIDIEARKKIMEKAAACESEIYESDLSCMEITDFSESSEMRFKYDNLEMRTGLLGNHQIKNICTALTALEVIKKKFYINNEAISKGVFEAYIPCRMEKISSNPLIILDGAHNPAGAKALSDFINKNFEKKKLLGIIGMFKDKDYENVIRQTVPLFEIVYTVEPKNPRALRLEKITNVVKEYNNNVKSFKSIYNAVKNAFLDMENYDAVFVYGTFSIMKEVKSSVKNLTENL